jgi:hypothetical protein
MLDGGETSQHHVDRLSTTARLLFSNPSARLDAGTLTRASQPERGSSERRLCMGCGVPLAARAKRPMSSTYGQPLLLSCRSSSTTRAIGDVHCCAAGRNRAPRRPVLDASPRRARCATVSHSQVDAPRSRHSSRKCRGAGDEVLAAQLPHLTPRQQHAPVAARRPPRRPLLLTGLTAESDADR